ncbi:hypothetical protein Ccrd_022353 [Cynara cardunculus var. scolymus]|uniref:Uncharacterized protein n=1 Tax=Cynara cardunculus var. scolymus TaxID=59895 RepID=A0A118JZE9_CYNCS|nr:hypothetical protein Ccrd_022353 [Cynara cardunculus var. scolymus]
MIYGRSWPATKGQATSIGKPMTRWMDFHHDGVSLSLFLVTRLEPEPKNTMDLDMNIIPIKPCWDKNKKNVKRPKYPQICSSHTQQGLHKYCMINCLKGTPEVARNIRLRFGGEAKPKARNTWKYAITMDADMMGSMSQIERIPESNNPAFKLDASGTSILAETGKKAECRGNYFYGSFAFMEIQLIYGF